MRTLSYLSGRQCHPWIFPDCSERGDGEDDVSQLLQRRRPLVILNSFLTLHQFVIVTVALCSKQEEVPDLRQYILRVVFPLVQRR